MESLPAVLEGAKSLVENKGFIGQLWQGLTTKLLGKKSTIVFTGLAGAGKTTLFDCLSGRTELVSYKPPRRSTEVEKRQTKVAADPIHDDGKKRLAYVVIPGQESSIRQAAFEELFTGKDEIAGIIHVVSGGLPTLRENVSAQILADNGIDTIEKFRSHQLEAELEDLDLTCKAIERYMTASRKPIWMMVAVNKIDLFSATIEHEMSLYSKATTPFAERLNLLQKRVGSLFFDWDIVPVSAWLEDFRFNGQKIDSSLKRPQQQQYAKAFIEKIIDRC